MAIHPDRHGVAWFVKETGTGENGFVVVVEKTPEQKGGKNDLLIFCPGRTR